MSILDSAMESVRKTEYAYCKFLSANDSGGTNSHQCGILVSSTAEPMLFSEQEMKAAHPKRDVTIVWQNDVTTRSRLYYYRSKKEFRITRFGRGFPYLKPDMTGSLFIFTRQSDDHYCGYFLENDQNVEDFLETFNLSPSETNRLIERTEPSGEQREQELIQQYVSQMGDELPSTSDMSRFAMEICGEISIDDPDYCKKPDETLVKLINEEYALYRAAESAIYKDKIVQGFASLDEFLELAKSITNTRKSRSGKSLEHHLSQILIRNGIPFTPQSVTEDAKKPDFMIPSIDHYHDPDYPVDKLATLSAKTTCKDRWRQIINEADRLRDRPKYLCTLQQGLSSKQLSEMKKENVILVVPKEYIKTYPEQDDYILSLEEFIRRMKIMLE